MAAKKTTTQQLAKLRRDDANFAALRAVLADESGAALVACKREVDQLRKGAKRGTTAVTRLRKRVVREKNALKRSDTAAARRALRATETELAKARKTKAANAATLAAARERLAEAKALATRHKKYATLMAQADRALARGARKRRA